MVVICEGLRESSILCVGLVLPLQGVYRFEWQLVIGGVLLACLVYCWWIRGVGYGLLTSDIDIGQRSACLCLF
jgi:hypothetical protein